MALGTRLVHRDRRSQLMAHDIAWGSGPSQLDMTRVESGMTALLEACERAVETIGSAVPPVQLRALLIIDKSGSLNLNRLAAALGASASATSRLCDRMQAAGLVTRGRTAASRREIAVLTTESGRRLADWVRAQRRDVLGRVLEGMSPDGREALAHGLDELAADSGQTSSGPPQA